MRRIEVVEKTYDSFLFSIDKYAFKYTQENKKQMIKYQIELDISGYKAADVRFLLEDIDPNFEFLLFYVFTMKCLLTKKWMTMCTHLSLV